MIWKSFRQSSAIKCVHSVMSSLSHNRSNAHVDTFKRKSNEAKCGFTVVITSNLKHAFFSSVFKVKKLVIFVTLGTRPPVDNVFVITPLRRKSCIALQPHFYFQFIFIFRKICVGQLIGECNSLLVTGWLEKVITSPYAIAKVMSYIWRQTCALKQVTYNWTDF